MYSSALFESITPRSGRAYLITDCDYLIDNRDKVFRMVLLEIVFCIFLFDGLPTVKSSAWRLKNSVLGVERGHGNGVVSVERLVILRGQRSYLLGYSWIDRVFFLGEGWQNEADCQSYKGQ